MPDDMPDDRKPSPPLLWTTVAAQGPRADESAVRRDFGVVELSRESAFIASAIEILAREFGYALSLRRNESVLGDGRPAPMMSYGFVEYLISLDLSSFSVLEIGGGQSTLFWSARARSVVTLEHDREWAARISLDRPGNVRIVEVGADGYAAAVAALDEAFDIIVIDCAANRYECAQAAGPKLRDGGLIILDNSDWHPNTAAYLRSLDLIQVDYPDFRALHHFRCTTSAFLHPDFRPVPAGPRLPPVPLGGKDIAPVNQWDLPTRGQAGR
jgi:predicted O-methyltransferase YrrM